MSFNEEMKASISKRKGSRERRCDNPKRKVYTCCSIDLGFIRNLFASIKSSSLKDIFFI